MLAVARDNFDLTRYLIKEVLQSPEQRLESLRKFYPNLNPADWRLEIAGQRVQIIKKDAKKGGILQFGTELVAAEDGTIAALLGASPGASVTVSIMLNLIERCFAAQAGSDAWAAKLKEIFPAREKVLEEDAALYRSVSEQSDKALQLA
jgi:malate dehydrogenase (quinone)